MGLLFMARKRTVSSSTSSLYWGSLGGTTDGTVQYEFDSYLASTTRIFDGAPDPLGPRGMAMSSALVAAAPYIRCCPFFPVQTQPTELPATTEGRWRRRHLSPGHKAGPLAVFWFSTALVPCFVCLLKSHLPAQLGISGPACWRITFPGNGAEQQPSHRATCWESPGNL